MAWTTVAVLLLVTLSVIGWHYGDRILGPAAPARATGQRVIASTDSTVTLASTPKARRPGYWAIAWPGGYGRIGPLLRVDADTVVTHFERVSGPPPDSTARIAGFAFDAAPNTWLRVRYDDVGIPSRIGRIPAWLIPGPDSVWGVFVHGRGASRAEMLRMLPAYVVLGLPCLVITYRNDVDGLRVGDGRYRLGATEWQDLEDAVRYARDHGARGVVVVGCSMGGGIVMQFLRKSADRDFARVAVLDAPVLDWADVVADQGRQEHIPPPIVAWGEFVAAMRGKFRWDDLAQLPHAREFKTPMLIFHGDADETVPVRQSRAFAAARPDLVTLEVVHGAGHVESVNVDPPRYVATLSDWLTQHGIGSRAADRVAHP